MSSSDSRSAHDLQWPELCAEIAHFAVSEIGQKLALALQPSDDAGTAAMRQSVMAEVMRLSDAGHSLPVGAFRPVSESLLRVERGGIVSGIELFCVRECLRVALRLDRFGDEHHEAAPLLERMLAVDPELGGLRRELELTIDTDGEVMDEASPALAQARREVRKVRDEIKSKMSELIVRYRDTLQDGYFAERDGRYVLPVRTDAPDRFDGVVLGTSGSGSTLYVEPQELGALGNRLRLAEGEVERQVAIVLGRLCELLAPLTPEVRWAEEVCGRADLLFAIARFSEKIQAKIVPFGESGHIRAHAARHPLLCLHLPAVVESDLIAGPGRALILSGPNAGGKTVALKTLGLLAMMQSTGLPVPVDAESEIGFFEEVLCDIGDDQSLSMSLSTFSGHVERVVAIVQDAGDGSLVLFDELMGGTDPDEGAVLAIATVEALVSAGATVCVTTHYEALKEHAEQSCSMENGAVGFDFEKMEPTFKVTLGRAGASSALIVASRFGLPAHIVNRAESLLPEQLKKERQDRIETEQITAQLEAERARLERLREEQEALNRRLAAEIARQKERQEKELLREGELLRAEVKAARAEVRRVQAALKTAERDTLGRLQADLDRAASLDAVGGPLHQRSQASRPLKKAVDPQRIVPGCRITVAGFSKTAEVLEAPKKGAVLVLIGVMKMKVNLGDVVAIQSNPSKSVTPAAPSPPVKKSQPVESTEGAAAPALIKSEDTTLDLRGHRVEDGLLLLDQFVEELLRRREHGGFVLHGHGTGAMKEAVRSHLRAHPCVAASRPADRDEGGDAFSVFSLSL